MSSIVQSSEVNDGQTSIKMTFKPGTTLAEAKAHLAEHWPQPTYGWKLFGDDATKSTRGPIAVVWPELSELISDDEDEEEDDY